MAEPPMNPEKVLIVEDEDNERTGLAELVSAWGYRTETARDGVEGLEKVSSWSPGIVITDMKMPRMTGRGVGGRGGGGEEEVGGVPPGTRNREKKGPGRAGGGFGEETPAQRPPPSCA